MSACLTPKPLKPSPVLKSREDYKFDCGLVKVPAVSLLFAQMGLFGATNKVGWRFVAGTFSVLRTFWRLACKRMVLLDALIRSKSRIVSRSRHVRGRRRYAQSRD